MTEPARKRRWGCLIAALVVVGGGLLVCAPLVVAAATTDGVPPAVLLELDLEAPVVETGEGAGVAQLFADAATGLDQIVLGLERARVDDRVRGLVVKVGGSGHGAATAQEIRDAITAFRSSGKPAVCWSEAFGEAGVGTGGYYVATACDEIWLQPSGDLVLTGLFAETPFLQGTLQKLGVQPQFLVRKEFKNAPNTFLEQDYTAPHREALQQILVGITDRIAADVGAARKLDPARVKQLMAEGPFDAQTAKQHGLVDRVGYRDEVMAALQQKHGDAELLYLARYAERAGPAYAAGRPVALVVGAGAILRGPSQIDPLSGDRTLGASTMAGAIRAAVEDQVAAIVLRVNSPGGSYVGSDVVWREVRRAREKGVPVVVSMGDYAASGGYFVSMAADAIVAQPSTLTGSIGVYAGKFVLTGLLEKAGANLSLLSTTDNAEMYSSDRPWTGAGLAKMDAQMDRVYRDFVQKAADGRKKTFDELEAVARGRVWTGADAKERGLVDELGGLMTAVRLARAKAGLADGEAIELRRYPREKTRLEQLMALTGRTDHDSSDDVGRTSTTTVALHPAARDALRAIARAARVDVLTAPIGAAEVLP